MVTGSPDGGDVRGNSTVFSVGIVNCERCAEMVALSPANSTVTFPDGITRMMSFNMRALTRPWPSVSPPTGKENCREISVSVLEAVSVSPSRLILTPDKAGVPAFRVEAIRARAPKASARIPCSLLNFMLGLSLGDCQCRTARLEMPKCDV